MGMYLNSKVPYEAYKQIRQDNYFVDKSMLIQELIPALGKKNRYFCITRPRRFGKTVMANMVGAFFGRTETEESLFEDLAIAQTKNIAAYMHQYDVIYIDFSRMSEKCRSYEDYITRIITGLKEEILQENSDLKIDGSKALWDILQIIFETKNKRAIFVMDEWDAVFHMPFVTQRERQDYLLFLKNLLKDQMYVELAYMTGILPVAKYSDGSELNMFTEYNMATKIRFSEFFGFSDAEVDRLFEIYQEITPEPLITREELRTWYDGYYTAAGDRIYNPRSIVCALCDNQLANYWTSSGTYDSVFEYVKNNIADIQDDLALMISGEAVSADIQEYAATSMALETRDEIYSAMVVYGLLTYRGGYVLIPNRELMESYAAMMKKEKSLGYLYRLASASKKMLEATLLGDTETMAEILQYTHDTESPVLSYNNEVELSAVVNLAYLSARDQYWVEREEKAGKGYVDFIFYPVRKTDDGIILELKVDSTPEAAIRQIRERGYALRFRGKQGGQPRCTGRILAVGISYDKKAKKHSCRVEEVII